MAALRTVLLVLSAAALTLAAAASVNEKDQHGRHRRTLSMVEVGTSAHQHHTTPCNASVVGSEAACFSQVVVAANNADFPFMKSEFTTYPMDGSPWGIHLTGPYPDGVSYLVSWESYYPMTGAPKTLKPDYPQNASAVAKISTDPGTLASDGATVTGHTLHYKREYTQASGLTSYSYLSPVINHVVLDSLLPSTTYYYVVGDGTKWSSIRSFTTLASKDSEASRYPLRVGLAADVGQTLNSSITRDHIIANKPDIIITTGDFAYADDYGAADVNKGSTSLGNGTNQNRWDTMAVMWEPLFSTTPILGCVGNHEIESTGINAVINYTTTSFSFPSNYPFQSYSSRYPVAGTTDNFGNINNNLYYATTVGGVIRLITLNNYIPFHQGTPQYEWAMQEFASFDRSVTPWLFVQFHAPPYHTYYMHYKEMECFMSIYEDVFYDYGVDVVLNGHIHAYERTHPVYKYEVNTCAPIYITIGDGGNIEGPFRNFVDETNPVTKRPYCMSLASLGLSPTELFQQGNTKWGPLYQWQAHPPNCPTTSWQPASSIAGGPVLVPLNASNSTVPLGFCQSSQPLWSAYRDPSFGHGILEVLSDDTINMSWYRNSDGGEVAADQVTLKRQDGCRNRNMVLNQREESRVRPSQQRSQEGLHG